MEIPEAIFDPDVMQDGAARDKTAGEMFKNMAAFEEALQAMQKAGIIEYRQTDDGEGV